MKTKTVSSREGLRNSAMKFCHREMVDWYEVENTINFFYSYHISEQRKLLERVEEEINNINRYHIDGPNTETSNALIEALIAELRQSLNNLKEEIK